MAAYLNARRQLLTDENFELFEEIKNTIYSGRSAEALHTRDRREALILEVCYRFQMPEELLTTKDAINDLHHMIRSIACRIKLCEDRGLSKGSFVYLTTDPKKESREILKIHRDFSLRLEGLPRRHVHPRDVSHVPLI